MNSHINTALNFYLGSMRASFYLFVHSNNDMFRPYSGHHQVYVRGLENIRLGKSGLTVLS
jgi:hypothetical protein